MEMTPEFGRYAETIVELVWKCQTVPPGVLVDWMYSQLAKLTNQEGGRVHRQGQHELIAAYSLALAWQYKQENIKKETGDV